MDSLTDWLGGMDDCLADSCKDGDCNLYFTGIDRNLLTIVACEKCARFFPINQPKPDFIVQYRTGSELIVAVVEMETSEIDAREVREQIYAGTRFVHERIGSNKIGRVLPILLHRGHFHSQETRILRQRPIEFRGKKPLIILEGCDAQLMTIIRKHKGVSL